MDRNSPQGILKRLGAVVSPDLDAYASGRISAAEIRCLICRQAPCDCAGRGLTFGSDAYFARLDEIHGRGRKGR